MPQDIFLNHMLPELSVIFLAFFVMIVDLILTGKKTRILGIITTAGLALSLAVSIAVYGEKAQILNQALIIDDTTSFFRVLLLAVATLIALATIGSTESKRFQGEFYAMLLFSLVGAMLLAASNEMITLYLSLELLALPAYALVAFRKENKKSNEGALKYMLLGLIASAFILYAMSLMYGLTGETAINKIFKEISVAANPALFLASLLFVAGFAFKMAAIPFHFWAPDAYDGAEPQVAAYLASISKIAAFAAAVRIFYGVLPGLSEHWSTWFGVIAAITMLGGALAALPQRNIKRILAYSSISHAGFVMFGLAIPTALAYQGMLFYLFVYGFGSAGIFLAIAALSKKYEMDTLDDYKGLAQKSPIMAFCFAVLILSLIGIPPLAGFWGKLFILAAAIDAGVYWLAIVGAVSSIISLGYYIGILMTIYIQEPDEKSYEKHVFPLRLAVYIATFIMFALAFNGPLLDMASQATTDLLFVGK